MRRVRRPVFFFLYGRNLRACGASSLLAPLRLCPDLPLCLCGFGTEPDAASRPATRAAATRAVTREGAPKLLRKTASKLVAKAEADENGNDVRDGAQRAQRAQGAQGRHHAAFF
jgi:hypothetical protein